MNTTPRTILIGDVHGCLDELRDLLAKVDYNKQAGDRAIIVGDLVDRGPDSPGVVRYAMDNGIEAIMGNHEHKLLRRWGHIDRTVIDPAYRNPMKPSKDQEDTIAAMGAKERAFLGTLPLYLELPEHGVVLAHAGILDRLSLSRTPAEVFLMIRYLDNDSGKMRPMEMPGFRQPANSYYWADRYRGQLDVVFGHQVHSYETPKAWPGQKGGAGTLYGIDTGCVFGGRLTALVAPRGSKNAWETVQVDARREYSKRVEAEL